MTSFEFKCTLLQQDLGGKTEKLKYQKKTIERMRINIFYKNPNKVYRTMKRSTIIFKSILSKKNVAALWKGIWSNPSECYVKKHESI